MRSQLEENKNLSLIYQKLLTLSLISKNSNTVLYNRAQLKTSIMNMMMKISLLNTLKIQLNWYLVPIVLQKDISEKKINIWVKIDYH